MSENVEKILSHIKEVRTELSEVKDGSARQAELNEKHDRMYDAYMAEMDAKASKDAALKAREDAIDAKLKAIETAINRGGLGAAEEAVKGNPEYKEAFGAYIRKQKSDNEMVELEQKLMQVGVDPDGGVRVPEDVTNRVVEQVYETSPMRQVATTQTTSRMEIVVFQDLDEAGGGWEDEDQDQSETASPELGKIKIPVHKVTAEPHATEEMLSDADFSLETWLSGKVARKLARLENTAFVNGNGVGKPRGFLTYTAGTDLTQQQIQQVETAASSTFDETDLVNLIGELKLPYRMNGSWTMGRLTHKNLFNLRDGDGDFLFDINGLRNMELWGYPIVLFEDMAGPTSGSTYADNVLPIAFGDFRESYMVGDRQGLRVLVDPYTKKGRVKYYTTRRTGGGVINFEGLKILKIKAA